jgi:proline iminopeptidase
LFHARPRNGFYATPNPTPQAQQRYTALVDHPDYKRWGNAMTEQAPLGFHRNDAYTQMKMYDIIRQVLQKKSPRFRIVR